MTSTDQTDHARSAQPDADAAPIAPAFSLLPLTFAAFSGTMAMMGFMALAGPIARVIGLYPWQLGLAVTIAGIAWMVMSRIWGGASDIYGRRPVILVGLSGFTISYFLLSLVVDIALRTAMAPMLALAGMILGRGLAGAFYAALPATSAALVADNVPPAGRGKAMAAIGSATAAGLVVGPGFAGLVAPVNLSLPLYLIAVLPVIAIAPLWRTLPRAAPPARPENARKGLADARLYRPMAVAFVAMASVTITQITIGFYALDRLGLDPAAAAHAAGISMAAVGVALMVAQTIMRGLDWSPASFIRIGATIAGLGFISVIWADTVFLLWVTNAVAAFGMGWVYPSISAMAANAVEPHEQGATAGSIGALQGLGSIVGPMAGAFVYEINPGVPYAVAGTMLLLTAWWPVRARP